MPDHPCNVLFLCTGNSCRSSIAEALLNHLDGSRFNGYSAGSHPAGRVNPGAIQALKRQGIAAHGLRSKNWDEFDTAGAPVMDVIITVCDNAAGETCPVWPGHPLTAHWGLSDPALFKGTDEETAAVFDATLHQLEGLIRGFLDLPQDQRTAKNVNGLLTAG